MYFVSSNILSATLRVVYILSCMLVLSVLSSKIIFGFGQVWLSSPDLCSAGIADSAAIPIQGQQEPRGAQFKKPWDSGRIFAFRS